MKKIFYSISAFALLTLLVSFTGTDKSFEGKIVYEISMEGANLPPEAQAMFAGSEMTLYIKGQKTRSEMNMAFQNTISISDRKANTSVTLMDVMGNKYLIKNDVTKENEKTPEVTVKEMDETKTIAGYKCKRADLTFKDKNGKDQSSTVYYSEELVNLMGYDKRSYQFKSIKGMPLLYTVNTENGMTMKMEAKSVSKEAIPDNKFEIPTGYKETTMEELQKEMMKNMSGK